MVSSVVALDSFMKLHVKTMLCVYESHKVKRKASDRVGLAENICCQ